MGILPQLIGQFIKTIITAKPLLKGEEELIEAARLRALMEDIQQQMEKMTHDSPDIPFADDPVQSDDKGESEGKEEKGEDHSGAEDEDIEAEADRLIASEDYYVNPRKQSRVAAIFKQLYPAEASLPDDYETASTWPTRNLALVADNSATIDPMQIIEPSSLDRIDAPMEVGTPDTLATNEGLLAEARELMQADDYWRDPHKQRRVAAIFKRLYPGTLRTAPLDFGEEA